MLFSSLSFASYVWSGIPWACLLLTWLHAQHVLGGLLEVNFWGTFPYYQSKSIMLFVCVETKWELPVTWPNVCRKDMKSAVLYQNMMRHIYLELRGYNECQYLDTVAKLDWWPQTAACLSAIMGWIVPLPTTKPSETCQHGRCAPPLAGSCHLNQRKWLTH